MADHDRVWFARETVRQLVKAQKMCRLYGRRHAHAASALTALGGLVRSFNKLHDTLALEIRKEGLFVGNDAVLDEGSRDGNLAITLYAGGVRALAFLEGVTDEELGRFLGVLAAPPEEDLSALLAREDLPHIHAICLDELTEGWEIPENLSEAAQKKIDMLNLRAQELIDEIEKRRLFGAGNTTFELSDTAAELALVEKVGAQGSFDGSVSDVGFVGVPTEILEELRTELRKTGPDDVTKALVEVALDALVLAPDELPAESVRWFLETATRGALARRELSLVAWLAERFAKELQARTSPALVPARSRLAAVLEPVISSMGDSESVDQLVDALTGEVVTGAAAFCRVATVLGPRGVSAAVTAYIKTTNKEVREALNSFIALNADKNPNELGRLCAGSVPVETAKWALFTASKHLRGPLAEGLFAQALQHPEPAVSSYANFLWRTNTPAGRLRAFMDALDAADPAERIRAAENIARSGDFMALEALKKIVDEASFLDRTPEEKRAILAAVVAIGGASSTDFLRRQTERATGLFRRRAGAEVREAAEKLLDGLKKRPAGGPGAEPPHRDGGGA